MGLISAVSEKLTGSSHKTEPSEHVQPGTNEKKGTANATSAAGTTGTHNTSTTHGTGVDSAAGSGNRSTRGVTGTEDASRNAGQLRSADLNETDLSSAKGLHTVKHAAPVVAEHVHDRYDHIDKTRIEELREKTEVTQTVQPVYDEVKHGATHERVDHGLEVHEHGHRGLDSNAEAELARKREQIAKEHRSTHDEETKQTSLRPDVEVHQRTNVVEEVVPVIEKDILRPHEIEHVKHEVHVHHDRPQVAGTTVAKPISMNEYEKASGVKIHDLRSTDNPNRDTLTTDRNTHDLQGSNRSVTDSR